MVARRLLSGLLSRNPRLQEHRGHEDSAGKWIPQSSRAESGGHMTDDRFNDPTTMVPLRLEDRNRIAQQVIDRYASNHAAMDVGVGLVGLIPGAAIPALMTAIGLQGPAIYQPLARRLAGVYLASPEDLNSVQDNQVIDLTVITAGFDLTSEFGLEFLKQIASELLVELGFGTALTFIPIVGAVAAAGLDYLIATRMTQRVGKMVAIYFQNGAAWVGSKRETYELAKNLPDDLNAVRKISAVRQMLLRKARAIVNMLRSAMGIDQIREILRAQKVPEDLIDEALAA
jgi:uncharacterized protein (DUF697 family)